MERWDERDHDADGWVTAAPMNVIDIRTGEQFVRLVPRPRVVTPAPKEPKDWWLAGCTWPGVPEGPYTLEECERLARRYGGRVFPWEHRQYAEPKLKAQGDYPGPGQMSGGGAAKYGKALQNGKGEE